MPATKATSRKTNSAKTLAPKPAKATPPAAKRKPAAKRTSARAPAEPAAPRTGDQLVAHPATSTARKPTAKRASAAKRATKKPAASRTANAARKTTAARKKPAARKPAARKTAAAAPPPVPVNTAALPEGAPRALELCLRALDEKKAGDVSVFDVRERSSVTNFFVVATATSEPHLRALRVAIEKEFADGGEKIVGRESGSGTGWTVVDAFDVIIHLFLPARRAACQLEDLWQSPRPRNP